jgi:hypothetical protein
LINDKFFLNLIKTKGVTMHRGYTCLWRKIWANAILAEPAKRFSRLEAWLYITNVLAIGINDSAAGLKRGEFTASVRQLAGYFNWSIGAVHRFLEILLQNSMIVRVGHLAEHSAERFSVCNYDTYNAPRYRERNSERNTFKEVFSNIYINNKYKDTHHTPMPADKPACMSALASAKADVSPKILPELYKQHNQSLPEVKVLTAERLRKCRSRINQAVRDGCLEQYLADFAAAVKKAQQTPFLRGEGARGWRASFDWFVANHGNVYAVLEGKYDSLAKSSMGLAKAGGNNASDLSDFDCEPGGTSTRRTSRGDLIYRPRQ